MIIRKTRSILVVLATSVLIVSCGGSDSDDSAGVGTDSGVVNDGTNGDVTDGDSTDGDMTEGDSTDGDATDGDSTDGDGTDGDMTDGDSTDGDMTDGDGTDGDATDGDSTDGNGTDGDMTDGDSTDGDMTDGDSTDGDATDGDSTDGDGTDGDMTDGDSTDGDATDGDSTDGDMTDIDNDAPADTTNVVAIDISSEDGGATLTGTMMYSSEGPVGFSGSLRAENSGSNLSTQIQFGGDDAEFVTDGRWVVGSRDAQHVNELIVSSDDDGATLSGTMKYVDEGDIGVTAVRQENLWIYDVDNTFSGTTVDGGAWVIGSRRDIDQGVVAVDIVSDDGGENFTGTMRYSGEGDIGFRAERIAGNSYKVEIQFGGDSADFVDADYWIIGGRDGRAVALQVTSDDDGETLTGTMTYDFEGEIAFSAVRSGGDAYRVENQFNGSTGDGGLWILGSR